MVSLINELATSALFILGNRLNQKVETKLKKNKGNEKNAELLYKYAIDVS